MLASLVRCAARLAAVRRHVIAIALITIATSAAPRAQTSSQAAIPITVQVATAPPAITFSWPLDAAAFNYSYVRRPAGAVGWGAFTTIPGGGAATSFTDANVTLGERYEYWFLKVGSPSARTILTAGIEAAPLEDRGVLVLLVDASKVQSLGARLDRLISDLTGDGWSVRCHYVDPTDSVPNVKARIQAEAAAHGARLRSVFLLGRLPVPYSGSIAPDGHPDHRGAWPADVYYGELDGNWTDSSVQITTATRAQNRNVPGDGKFDQSSIPGNVELAVGRVDFANMPAFPLSEAELLANYLDKNHAYRQRQRIVEPRAVIDDNFGWFSGEAFAASGWRNFGVLLGNQNIVAADYFTTLDTQSGDGYLWSYGCGGGSYTSAGGVGSTANFVASANRNVFTMLFGSYFGDWDSTDNFLRAPLCSGWTLASAWAGRPHWSFHPMGLGDSIGACVRVSQNDTAAGGSSVRSIHIALMGDPTLRQHVVAPPSQLAVAIGTAGMDLTWSAAAEPVAGYHVYRAASPLGPFTRITAQPILGTSYADSTPPSDCAAYMVRAVQLENTPTGSYWNLSQGAIANAPQPIAAHVTRGRGCYTVSDSLYADYATPAEARAALQGRALTWTPNGANYDVDDGRVGYVAPTASAVALMLGDDEQVAVTLPAPLATPSGARASLSVHSNGIVALDPLTFGASVSATPLAAALLGEASAAFYAWHDFDPSEPGSGSIVFEDLGDRVHITWLGVEGAPAGLVNPSTLQFQFELAAGIVHVVWHEVSGLGGGAFGTRSQRTVVGYSPAGPSVDAGAIDFATALPASLGTSNSAALTLSASPRPLSTHTQGTLVDYRIEAIPQTAPGSGVHQGALLLGIAGAPGGIPLAAIGMPGCELYVAGVDVALPFGGASPTQVVQLSIPPGLPCGVQVFATAAAFAAPGSVPGGQGNTLGVVTSNGIESIVAPF